MFAMRGNPYLNALRHEAKGIKKLILIQAVFDVLGGQLPRDFTAGWFTMSLAVDRIYQNISTWFGKAGGAVHKEGLLRMHEHVPF